MQPMEATWNYPHSHISPNEILKSSNLVWFTLSNGKLVNHLQLLHHHQKMKIHQGGLNELNVRLYLPLQNNPTKMKLNR
jgi:hypothetical protein